ncbi:AI-2E family transporter [Halomonas urumqiensis]|uniref:AI-2E family transporter n=1 Tax=Halomonas urumqiensis TaxID=1684789 RepID=A0A2N7UFV5_9GAMM|nr:AI-2E family transporter [Halomonas urumqiensis]PMR79302.1 AI-2E family transporter [Halomonas urumqiensis]PTB03976.1 AI-2E family transporter [Halomonas urumqiensis]GHE19767.1 AI-2E family transporter [Halomonas urumqiensis]
MQRQWWVVAGVAAVMLWFFISIEPVLMPFFVSMVLAYLSDPLADRLEARGLSRRLSVTLVFSLLSLVIILTLLLVVPILWRQLGQLIESLPVILNWFQSSVVPRIQSLTGMDLSTDIDQMRQTLVDNWKETGTVAATLLSQVSRSGLALVAWIGNIALIPVVTFYLLLDWDVIVGKIRNSLPRKWEPATVRLAGECDEVLSAFLRGQLIVMLCLGVIYAIGLSLLGVRFGLLIGMLAGLASIVPYLGVIVGISVAGVVAFFQFGDWLILLGVAAVFGFGQVVESVVLQPKLLGDKIGLHPVAVIFAVLAGGKLFGFTGVLLALPVAAMIMVVLRYLHEHYKNSTLYDDGVTSIQDKESQ